MASIPRSDKMFAASYAVKSISFAATGVGNQYRSAGVNPAQSAYIQNP
jgi:hypothetical protein